ncbi:hypothetical protein A5844_002086 [Enterococcus sp. 10A9_DIV0425]|uniref:Uncharacterized protein n=1 Tax=Candidatus Enterococcus wittei TaxID=1987383 RepID=A0A242JYJ1_9ENTE|nr:hypothetical protein [Enterococcus sp. 10A9_DIV0425]OTP10386.1 hypothetical protein A5844_002086 [Enterococcus sp. 10A9_DIV0425]
MKNKEIKEELTRCFVTWIIIPFALILSGCITMYLWNGIISKTFGLNILNFWQALGLDIFVSYLTYGGNKGEDKRSNYEVFVSTIAKALLFLLLGFVIIHLI